ncbi:MAG: TonB-dependent receptor domain-containing protein [Myxococcaceae bacterium]
MTAATQRSLLFFLLTLSSLAAAEPFTGVKGRISDAKSGDPLIECVVRVTAGGAGSATTDLEGNYVLTLKPGKYQLRVWYDGYQGVDVKDLVVAQGQTTPRDLKLAPLGEVAEEIVVVGKVDRHSESGLLFDRKRATVVSDSVSAQEIARTADSSAADAVKRVVSVTTLDNKGVVMRGLSGRYATATVNGVTLPSPDPDGNSIPLDLFPTALLSNMTVQKSYSAEMSGAFAGGALSLDTQTYPDKFRLSAKLSGGGDTETTFRFQPSYRGGSTDWLTVDDGTRALPAAIPRNGPAGQGSAADIEAQGESFNDNWDPTRRRAIPALGLSVNLGDTAQVAGKNLGYVASLTYGRREINRQMRVQNGQVAEDGSVVPQNTLDVATGTESANIGGLINAGLSLSEHHDIGVLSLFTRTADNMTYKLAGYSEGENEIEAARLQFNTRMLSFNQLRGSHQLSERATFKWQGNYSHTQGDEPDTRDATYSVQPDGSLRMSVGTSSMERLFTNLNDNAGGAGAHLAYAFTPVTFRFGATAQVSTRNFDSRRLRYEIQPDSNQQVLGSPASRALTPEFIGPDFKLVENTQQGDRYNAMQGIYAAYTTAEINAGESLRLIPGVRYEASNLYLKSGSRTSPFSMTPASVNRLVHHVLPSLNAVFKLTANQNLRASYAYTLARPQFRELGPFLYYDFSRRRSITGNPNLVETRIHNADLRWEWFPSEMDVLAATVFAKQFTNPIEQVNQNVTGDLSFVNTPLARSGGVELEARTSLSRLSSVLSGFRLGGNLSLVYSRIDLGHREVNLETNRSRPLQGQSPYLVNLNAGYLVERTGTEVTVLYNVAGPRIIEVGTNGLPDIYDQPIHRLDLTFAQNLGPSLRLKLTGTNLLNSPTVAKQGALEVYRYRTGVAANVSLEWVMQ